MAAQPAPVAVAAEQPPDLFMNKEALIIFVRHPELGKVKTRLAKDIGDAAALNVYQRLLAYTHSVTLPLPCNRFVFYAGEIAENDIWNTPPYFKKQQQGSDLGERIKNAFQELFVQGYERVIIIGSDCPQVTTDLLHHAFSLLWKNETVIGPSHDGGYYLLGLTRLIPGIFENKNWSTESVFNETMATLRTENSIYEILPVLRDVDRVEDLEWMEGV